MKHTLKLAKHFPHVHLYIFCITCLYLSLSGFLFSFRESVTSPVSGVHTSVVMCMFFGISNFSRSPAKATNILLFCKTVDKQIKQLFVLRPSVLIKKEKYVAVVITTHTTIYITRLSEKQTHVQCVKKKVWNSSYYKSSMNINMLLDGFPGLRVTVEFNISSYTFVS